MKTQQQGSEAADFLRSIAVDILAEPRFSTRAAIGASPEMAAEIAALALSGARAKLPKSKAAIAFEAVCVSNRDALADSVGSAFGAEASAALRADPAAMAAIPERSETSLSAWRFPDGSFLLCSLSGDGSLEAFGKALASSAGFLKTVGGERAESVSRALALARSQTGAFPLARPALEAMLQSMARDGASWLPGTRVLARDNGRAIAPSEMLESLADPPEGLAPLERLLSEAMALKAAGKLNP